jgi:hypothetical protein
MFSVELSKKNKIQRIKNIKVVGVKVCRSDALWQQNGTTPTSNYSQN